LLRGESSGLGSAMESVVIPLAENAPRRVNRRVAGKPAIVAHARDACPTSYVLYKI
jgi:hypothetical protein